MVENIQSKLLKTPSFPLKENQWQTVLLIETISLVPFLRLSLFFNTMFICDSVFRLKEVHIDEIPNRCV